MFTVSVTFSMARFLNLYHCINLYLLIAHVVFGKVIFSQPSVCSQGRSGRCLFREGYMSGQGEGVWFGLYGQGMYSKRRCMVREDVLAEEGVWSAPHLPLQICQHFIKVHRVHSLKFKSHL